MPLLYEINIVILINPNDILNNKAGGIIKYKANKKSFLVSVCIVILLFISVFPLVEVNNFEFQGCDTVDRMTPSSINPFLEKAKGFFVDYEEKNLLNIELKSSSQWQSNLIELRWETSFGKPLEIRFDRTSGQVVFFFDSVKADQQLSGEEFITIDDAFQQAVLFLLKHHLGEPVFGLESKLLEPTLEQNCWVFTWSHSVIDFEVKGDSIELWVNIHTGQVCSFIQKWSKVNAQEIQEPDTNYVNQVLELNGLKHLAETVESVSRCYIAPSQQNNPVGSAIAAYAVRFLNRNQSQEIWFAIDDGCIVGGTEPLSFGQVEITISLDTLGYGTLIEEAVHARFQTNYYDPVTSTYEATADDITSIWDDSDIEILFHFGHGYLTQNNNDNYIVGDDAEEVYAGEVLELDASPHFVYICSCYSGYYDESREDFHYFATAFVNENGAEAFLGWEDEVYRNDAYYFTKIFFNYALNEYEIDTCASIARLIVGGSTIGNVVIYGDENLKLWEYNDNLDTSPGRNLGTVTGEEQDAYWNVYDEPLWAPDNDWFYFTITGGHEILIWAIPNEEDFDIVFRLYLPSSGWITVNNGQEGDTEFLRYVQSSGTSKMYRIKIYYTTPYYSGGSYDLRVDITS